MKKLVCAIHIPVSTPTSLMLLVRDQAQFLALLCMVMKSEVLLLRPSYPSSLVSRSSDAPNLASTSCMLCIVYISFGDSVPVNSHGCWGLVSTFFCFKFLSSSVASSALLRFRELLWESLYKRKAIRDERAIRRVPNETPTPIPIFAD